MRFEVTILGSNSATPAYGRNQTSQILNINEKLYLIDCGEGTQLQLLKYKIKLSKIRCIFISHLHGDHYLGLVGLISTMNLNGRTDELFIYGPPELKEIIDIHLKYSETTLRYDLIFRPTQTGEEEVVLENEDIRVLTFPLIHRIACTGFRFDENAQPAKLNMEVISRLQVPLEFLSKIKKGENYTTEEGQTYKSSELTLPPRPLRSYAFCSDTLHSTKYYRFIDKVDLLYHEATFLHDMHKRAEETFHSTALLAATTALSVNAKKLLIGHFSSRYKTLDLLLKECQAFFQSTELAIEGNTYIV